FIPEKGDQVMVGFEFGDPNRPYVMGSLFHGKNAAGGGRDNNIRSIITKSGHTIEFDDSAGSLGITIKDKNGNIIRLDTQGKSIEISAPESIRLSAKNITLDAEENLDGHAGTNINMYAENSLDITAGEDCRLSSDNIYTQATSESVHSAKKHETAADKVRLDSTQENLELASNKEVDVQSAKKVKLF
ncbi:MAG: DUF2345 domain-containing protein, partial [Prevotellaceae bacterium]|nr:DUF2345 domain-containing protein [Prevotellaceae bacterium]